MQHTIMSGTQVIIGVEYAGGAVIGFDIRPPEQPGPKLQFNALLELSDHVLVCDSQIRGKYIRRSDETIARKAFVLNELNSFQMLPLSVEGIAEYLGQMLDGFEDKIQPNIIVAGWDKSEGGRVYLVTRGGHVSQESYSVIGPGSRHVLRFVEHSWRVGMTEEEAKKIVKEAVSHTLEQDGLCIDCGVYLYTINSDGITEKYHMGGAMYFDKMISERKRMCRINSDGMTEVLHTKDAMYFDKMKFERKRKIHLEEANESSHASMKVV